MRDTFQDRPAHFWSIVEQIQQVYYEYREDRRRPFSQFWESLAPALRCAPVVYVSDGRRHKWLSPSIARIPTGRGEESAARAFQSLGIDLVNPDHYPYRNILTHVGVRTLSISDIYDGLRARGLVETPSPYPANHDEQQLLKLLWTGCDAIVRNPRRRSSGPIDGDLMGRCVLAPGLDRRLWPCAAAYQADNQTRRVFANLIPDGCTFLTADDVPLLKRFCPRFSVTTAIEWLERIPEDRIHTIWSCGKFDPSELLGWFDYNKRHLTRDLRNRLAGLPICPAGGLLRPMNALYLPGGFEDPAGVANAVDTARVSGLSDFLGFLGIEELTFVDYARRYLPEAFGSDSRLSSGIKRCLLAILERRLSDIKVNDDIRASLAQANSVECMDGIFRKPQDVYFLSNNVKDLFGLHVSYARVPCKSVSRQDLYGWLGVAYRPRPSDVIALVKDTVSQPPSRGRRTTIRRVVGALGGSISGVTSAPQYEYQLLKHLRWLPAEGDYSTWWIPSELHATHFKHLFDSQARFIDVPQQDQSRRLVGYLGVNPIPEPYQVARHLLDCARHDDDPPGGVYRWLNDSAKPGHLSILHDEPCLRVAGRWLRPNQVFWGKHSFGRFRFQLGSDFRQYQKLLSGLNVKEDPDCNDAIEVLKEVGRQEGTRRLSDPNKDVVIQCWTILADALNGSAIDALTIKSELGDVRCVPSPRPNEQTTLDIPSLMFFDDGFGHRFELIKWNLIARQEHIWTALEAAGIRPLTDLVKGTIHEARGGRADPRLKELLAERMQLIKAVLEKSVARNVLDYSLEFLRNVQFQGGEELIVNLTVEAFGRSQAVNSPEAAFFDRSNSILYFALQDGIRPWSAIARELSLAIAPGENTVVLVPALRTVLGAPSRVDAVAELRDCGIQVPEGLPVPEGDGLVALRFEEDSRGGETPQDDTAVSPADPPSPPAHPESDSTRADVSSEGSQGEELPQVGRPQVSQEVDDRPGHGKQSEQARSFAELFFGSQTLDPSMASDSPVTLPGGGPATLESARADTIQSGLVGRSGLHVRKPRMWWQPTRASESLTDRFRNMTHSDYVKRCQICGNTFKKRSGDDNQVFVVHIVRPSSDDRTNHYGNLLGLCGWHYALIRYGELEFLHPETEGPFEDSQASKGWKHMQESIFNAPEAVDESGDLYVGLPVRFWNVFHEWGSDPETEAAEIRYCIPHWKYLCELLKNIAALPMSTIQPETKVRYRADPSAVGWVINVIGENARVFIGGTDKLVPLRELELAPGLIELPTDEFKIALTRRRIEHPVTDQFLSYKASKTRLLYHQFLPVKKMLESPDQRLLIADEVGTGKTIEAGLIWAELESRAAHGLENVWVSVPSRSLASGATRCSSDSTSPGSALARRPPTGPGAVRTGRRSVTQVRQMRRQSGTAPPGDVRPAIGAIVHRLGSCHL